MSNSSEIPIPIASSSTFQSTSSCSKISTSVQMSDGTCLPLSFRNSGFSRFPFTTHSSSPSHHGPQSVEMSSSPFRPSSQSKPSAALSFSLEAGFSLSPAGFHPASFTGPGSFGASHLARMESAFCQNFVCCAIPLRDLHDLLEHFEQAHCHAGDIVGVDGFEGVTLDQMAAGVGLSAELGLGPGTAPQNNNSDSNARRRRRPPSVSVTSRAAPASHTLHELRFEDEEEWSSGHDTSRSGSPAHLNRSPLQSHSEMQTGSEVEEDTMTRLGKTLRETLGTLRPNPITIDRSRNSSNSRSRSGSLSESHDDRTSAADRALSDLIASFRSKARGNRHDPLQSSRHSKHDNGNTNGFFGRIGVAPSELDGRNHRMEGGAIDPAVLLESHPFEGTDGLTDSFGDDDIPDHLQLDPEQLLKHQQQQRRRRRPNVDPVTGLTPTGRLPRPWTPVSEKPFKCSVPGCEKAYKQQNGLKYHKTHGHSSQVEYLVDRTLYSKRLIFVFVDYESHYFNRPFSQPTKNPKRSYAMTLYVGKDTRRPHGALGIQLLSLGVHPPPQYPPGHKKSSMINSSNPSFCPPASSSCSSPPSF
ncbi:uncharacterized protein MELLADRAFT_111572 [Melampsora larici-populina 98AG31]|uniref:C2H2-type domain-containing protein n=1 Tax=Melampsora larici-populina (strain 98AG31 / pathotype 3-4-7) TaxID=747676 RepID=F4S3M4_MELLP|nr:uncharacterized protein MELLADRAFT_111572 [Melampsora larici-populina 98AG31]EGG00699.1 hypothetical protein MELLADRAFT_111572 [Melampsora larici-populina 98AG31]